MCTTSWDASPERDLLWFNRDEQRTRSPAFPPAQGVTPEGARFIAPKDPDGGGGWIGANDQGLLVCLLNAYDLGTPVTPPERSRGLVVMDLLDTSETDEALERLKTLVKDYEIAPCRILCWSRIPPPCLRSV